MLDKNQLEELRTLVTTDEFLLNFFKRLSTQFGDGEVLPYAHIKNYLENELYKTGDVPMDTMSIYIDTYRILNMLNGSAEDLLKTKNIGQLIILHDSFKSDKLKTLMDEKSNEAYTKAVEPFIKLTQCTEDLVVELIATMDELNYEGSFMNHCIATYFMIIINKNYVGFRVMNTNIPERLTLGCIRNGEKLIFNQLKGNGNRPASKESRDLVIEYCNKNNIIIPDFAYDLYYEMYKEEKNEQS